MFFFRKAIVASRNGKIANNGYRVWSVWRVIRLIEGMEIYKRLASNAVSLPKYSFERIKIRKITIYVMTGHVMLANVRVFSSRLSNEGFIKVAILSFSI